MDLTDTYKNTYKNPKNDLVFVPVSATKSQMELHPLRIFLVSDNVRGILIVSKSL